MRPVEMGSPAEDQEALYPIDFDLNVQGRGLIILCCFPDPKRAVLKAGDEIELIRPDKSTLRTSVRSLGMVMDAQPGLLGLHLSDDVQKDSIPQGTMLRLLGARPTGEP